MIKKKFDLKEKPEGILRKEYLQMLLEEARKMKKETGKKVLLKGALYKNEIDFLKNGLKQYNVIIIKCIKPKFYIVKWIIN